MLSQTGDQSSNHRIYLFFLYWAAEQERDLPRKKDEAEDEAMTASNVRWLPVWREPLVARDLFNLLIEIDEMKRVLAERDRIRRESVRKCLKPRD